MSAYSNDCLTRRTVRIASGCVLAGLLAGLAGCHAPMMGPGHMGTSTIALGGSAPLQPPPAGRGVALLAPLTGENAGIGSALVDAARLGLGTGTVPPLATFDTGGTPAGAAGAAQQAIAQGAGLVLGPLTIAEARAVAPIIAADHVDGLAFTSDGSVAQPGLWALGITPAEQVQALLRAAHAAGHGEVAGLLPLTPLGEAMAQALRVAQPGASIEFYGDFAAMNTALRRLSDYADRRGPVDARIKALQSAHTEAGQAEAARLARQPVPPPPFDALVIAETGPGLGELASLLPYYDVDPGPVLVLGPGLWAADPAGVAAAGLSGALYAAPDPAASVDFVSRYQLQFGAAPPALASVAFDAGAIARTATQAGTLDLTSLTDPAGFAGADGVMALQPDGSVRRALAVFRATPAGGQIVQRAPTTLSQPLF
jgi:branched-chain amino acid transport system substrate-binding protein